MKKIMNKKGFTLIELLAVIVILGVIMLIAVPSISTVITNSRRDSFLRSADSYIDSARNMAISGTVQFQVDPTKATAVSIRAVDLESGEGDSAKSPFGSKWVTDTASTSTYVIIHNSGSKDDPKYVYYFAGVDAAGNCMELTREGEGTRGKVTTGCTITAIEKSKLGTGVSLQVGGKTVTLGTNDVVFE